MQNPSSLCPTDSPLLAAALQNISSASNNTRLDGAYVPRKGEMHVTFKSTIPGKTRVRWKDVGLAISCISSNRNRYACLAAEFGECPKSNLYFDD